MNKFLIPDPIYGQSFELIVNCTKKQADNFIMKKYKVPKELMGDEFSYSDGLFRVFEYKLKGDSHHCIALYMPKFQWTIKQQSILAHELMHFCYHVLSTAGIEHNKETDEAYAYYFQYITTECYLKLLKVKKDVRSNRQKRVTKRNKVLGKRKK